MCSNSLQRRMRHAHSTPHKEIIIHVHVKYLRCVAQSTFSLSETAAVCWNDVTLQFMQSMRWRVETAQPIRGHSFSTYAPKGVGGSRAMRTPMHCCHRDVIICAYRGEWVGLKSSNLCVCNKWMAPNYSRGTVTTPRRESRHAKTPTNQQSCT